MGRNECENLRLEDTIAPSRAIGARHLQVVLLFLLVNVSYLMRSNMSVAIVAMTDPKTSPNPDVPTYEWDDKSIILTAFYVGYIIPQVPAGPLAKNYGPKWILTVAVLAGSLLTIFTPLIADLGSWPISASRVLQGITQGFIFPSCHTLLSKWVPPCERARLCSFVYAGIPVGTALTMTLTGLLSATWMGWPSSFYIFGAVGLIWTLTWLVLGSNSPAAHGGINPQEKLYIETSLGQVVRPESAATPWKAILTSLPVWALTAAYFAYGWGFSTLNTNVPSYMAKVLNFNIAGSGILSAAPYLLFWVVSLIVSALTDFGINRQYVTVGTARKIANSIGLFIPAGALIILGLISDSKSDITIITLVLLFIAIAVNGSAYSGYRVNHMDLTLTHAGTLMGLTNGIATISSIIAPLLLQFIVTDEKDPQQWATIFYIASPIYIVGNTLFIIFGSGSSQPWNDP